MKKYIIAAAIGSLSVIGCSKKEEDVVGTKAPTETKASTAAKASAGFQAFTQPDNIQGCSCSFGATEADFQAGNFVYVDDYGNEAQVKINGHTEYFPMKEGDFLPDNFNKKLENQNYLLEISGKKVGNDPEQLRFEGTIKATDKKSQQQYTTPIIGECAC